MGQVLADRMSAKIEGDFVVFLIGMRINRWWKIRKWGSAAFAMLRMHRELKILPVEKTGCLESLLISPRLTVQYWRSFDHLEAYARDLEGLHMPAWKQFKKLARNTSGDIGIWHETFLVETGSYEALYHGMPQQGLGKAGRLVPATHHMKTARGRVNAAGEARRTMKA